MAGLFLEPFDLQPEVSRPRLFVGVSRLAPAEAFSLEPELSELSELSGALGASSAAYVGMLGDVGALAAPTVQGHKAADGGLAEWTGLAEALRRVATRVALFLAGPQVLKPDPAWYLREASDDELAEVYGAELFGHSTAERVYASAYRTNQIFARDELRPLLARLAEEAAKGAAAVAWLEAELLENRRWGLAAGRRVSVLVSVSVLARCESFEARLPEETRRLLDPNFPVLATLGQNGLFSLFGYTELQLNLVAAQAEFSVRSRAADYARLFGD